MAATAHRAGGVQPGDRLVQHDELGIVLFQSSRTAATAERTRRGDVLLFWLVQLGVLTPPLFALFASAAGRGVRRGWWRRDDNWNFVASFSLPLFFLFAAASFRDEIHVNWTAPAFLSLSLGASALALDGLESERPGRGRNAGAGAHG